jgi:hypothetical protein
MPDAFMLNFCIFLEKKSIRDHTGRLLFTLIGSLANPTVFNLHCLINAKNHPIVAGCAGRIQTNPSLLNNTDGAADNRLPFPGALVLNPPFMEPTAINAK